MAKVLYTMGETAQLLGESTSAVRYWSNYFQKYIHPSRNAKGNRLFHPEDVETLQQIHLLLKNDGLTLEGVSARLEADRRSVEPRVKALNALREIRAQLAEIRRAL